MIGQTISHYKILEKLGAGGMGVVYKAEDLKLDRLVALKFLPPHLSADDEQKKRFISEAKASSALDHPNIGSIYEIAETADGNLFIAMAYYDGETLKKRIMRGSLPLKEALGFLVQTAQGLAKAHDLGIIHRDLKPANIIITPDGIAKIIDFGLAKHAGRTQITKAGSTVGTIAYMSPEQARGEETDQRTDIWALGVTAYEMLAGRLPFQSDYEAAVVYSILNEDPKPLSTFRKDIQPKIKQLIDKMMAKTPADRYQNMREVLEELGFQQSAVQVGEHELSQTEGESTALPGSTGRRLVAIMFTDMVGYSALTQKNEALALELLKKHNGMLRLLFPKYRGTEIKTIGDAFLVEFESVLDVVDCAMEIQKALHEYNATASAGRKIQIRIGIHVGDVVHREGDVFGDGVNIAARVEPLANPGGICITEDVFRQIQNKMEIDVVKLGKGQLKNIHVATAIYQIIFPWEKKRLPLVDQISFFLRKRRSLWLIPVTALLSVFLLLIFNRTSESASVAVLPLQITGSNSEDQAWLAEGISQSIASKLTKLKGIRVTPWVSSQRYLDQSVSLKDVASQLGVQRLIVGTIRVIGDRIHASVQLIDPIANKQLWSEEFEEKTSNIFEVQTKIALGSAEELKGKLSGEEERLMAKPPADRADAYEFYIKGSLKMESETPEDNNVALAYFDRAIELDPLLAEAYVGRGAVNNSRFWDGWGGKESLDKAEENFKKALEFDPQSTSARRGLIHIFKSRGLNEECLKLGAAIPAMKLDDIGALSVKADAYFFAGLPDKAVPLFERILQLDRANRGALYELVIVLTLSVQAKKALDAGDLFFERFGEDPLMHAMVAEAHQMLGDLDAARIHYHRAIELFGGYGNDLGTYANASIVYRQLGDTAKAALLLTSLAKRLEETLQAYPSNFRMAGMLSACYALLGNYDEAEKLVAPSLPYTHAVESLIYLSNAGRTETARTIIQGLLSNGTDVLYLLRVFQAKGEKVSELEKEGFVEKQIELDRKYRALY